MSSSSPLRAIVSALAGGIVFIVFLLIGLPLLVGIGAAVLAFVVGLLFFRRSTSAATSTATRSEFVAGVIKSALEKLGALVRLANSLPPGEVRERLYAIARLTERIIDDVKADPKDAGAAGRFLDYYADATIKIGRMYGELAERGVNSTNAREIGVKVLKNLAALEKAFELQLSKLQEDNLLDLDTELTVLEKTLETEGIQAMIDEQQKDKK